MSDTQLRARALASAGRLAYFQSDLSGARTLLEEALSLFRQTDDDIGAVSALSTLIVILTWQGETDAATTLLREGIGMLPPVQGRRDTLPALSEFGWAASHISAPDTLDDAQFLNEDIIKRAEAAGEKHSLGLALACLAQCFYWRGEWDEARSYFEDSVPLLRDVGALWMLDYALWGLGQSAFQQGDLDAARSISSEAMLRDRDAETWIGAPYYLETFAFLAAAHAQPRRAVRLLGAAEALRARHHSVAQPLVLSQTQRALAQLRTLLPPTEFETLWKQGRTLTTEKAIALALQTHDTDEAP